MKGRQLLINSMLYLTISFSWSKLIVQGFCVAGLFSFFHPH